jgi:hypothetical protein
MARERCGPGGRNALQARPERAARPGGRWWAFRGPLAAARPSGHGAKPATGEIPGPCAGSPPAAGSGMETGLWRTGLADAGRTVNVRAIPHCERETVVRAGAWKSGDAGLPLSGLPCGTGSLSVGCGHHPAKFGPRAWARHRSFAFSRGKPRVRPSGPDDPAPEWSPSGFIGMRASDKPLHAGHSRAGMRPSSSANSEHSVAEIRSFMNARAGLCWMKGETS